MPVEIAAAIVGALLTAIGAGMWHCIKGTSKLSKRVAIVELLLKLHLKKNGTTDKEIEDIELAINGKGGQI